MLIGFLAALWCGQAIAQAPETYHWPLELPRSITSSFAEYRTGRFHAGIDLRTGPIGQPVHAPLDGYISRVRCSPWGYGKAVYLRLDDGNSVVFGHLDGFAEPLAEYVRKAQHERENYTVDLYPRADEFPVLRGDVIARSGQTGVGVPHLHYELRDSSECPINLRLAGVDWPDTTRPLIRAALICPSGAESAIDDDLIPVVRKARLTGGGEYVCDPVTACGRIGFGIDAIDPANEGANSLGVYIVRTLVGGVEVFRLQNDRLSYENNNSGAVAFHPYFLDEGCFLLQWRWTGNRSEPYRQVASDGWFDVPAEPVDVRIETEDFKGNTAAITIPIRPAAAISAPDPMCDGEGTGTVTLDCLGNGLLFTARFTAPEPVLPESILDGPAPAAGGAFRRIDATTFRAVYLPRPDARGATFRVRHPRIAAPFEKDVLVFQRGEDERSVEWYGVRMRVYSDSPYGELYVQAAPAADVRSSEITTLGTPLALWPESAPIDHPVDLSFPAPEGYADFRRVHVYRETGSGWSFEGGTVEGERMKLSTRRLGTYALMEDNLPPQISDIVPTADGPASNPRPAIHARVSDKGSGIAGVTITCNGRWLLAEFDPEQGLVKWAQDEDLPAGAKEIVFAVTDQAGNTTTAQRTID